MSCKFGLIVMENVRNNHLNNINPPPPINISGASHWRGVGGSPLPLEPDKRKDGNFLARSWVIWGISDTTKIFLK
jgi:hypothetical protein